MEHKDILEIKLPPPIHTAYNPVIIGLKSNKTKLIRLYLISHKNSVNTYIELKENLYTPYDISGLIKLLFY